MHDEKLSRSSDSAQRSYLWAESEGNSSCRDTAQKIWRQREVRVLACGPAAPQRLRHTQGESVKGASLMQRGPQGGAERGHKEEPSRLTRGLQIFISLQGNTPHQPNH